MTIKEIETLSGLPRANIRYYESEGLISPKRAENGYREYSQADVGIGPYRVLRIFAAAHWAEQCGIRTDRQQKEHTMTIKDMELQTGLARANIRYYESEGLIAPVRAENGYREYSQEDAETLLRVKLLRALGLTVGQIKALVRGETDLDTALSARIAAIRKEKAELDWAGEIAGRLRQTHAQFQTLDARPYLDEMQAERVLERDTLPKEHFPWQRFFARLVDAQIYRTLWVLILPALSFNMLKTGTKLERSYGTPVLEGSDVHRLLTQLVNRTDSRESLIGIDSLARYGGVNAVISGYVRRYDTDEVAELTRQQAQDLASLALADAANSSRPLDPRSDDFYSYAKGYDMDIQLRVVIDRETSTTVPLNVPAFALRMQKFIDGLEFQVDGTYDGSTVAVDEILYD